MTLRVRLEHSPLALSIGCKYTDTSMISTLTEIIINRNKLSLWYISQKIGPTNECWLHINSFSIYFLHEYLPDLDFNLYKLLEATWILKKCCN